MVNIINIIIIITIYICLFLFIVRIRTFIYLIYVVTQKKTTNLVPHKLQINPNPRVMNEYHCLVIPNSTDSRWTWWDSLFPKNSKLNIYDYRFPSRRPVRGFGNPASSIPGSTIYSLHLFRKSFPERNYSALIIIKKKEDVLMHTQIMGPFYMMRFLTILSISPPHRPPSRVKVLTIYVYAPWVCSAGMCEKNARPWIRYARKAAFDLLTKHAFIFYCVFIVCYIFMFLLYDVKVIRDLTPRPVWVAGLWPSALGRAQSCFDLHFNKQRLSADYYLVV